MNILRERDAGQGGYADSEADQAKLQLICR
jgi:hypothetical protein